MEPADVPVQRRTPRDVGMANMVAAARALLDDRPPEEITVRDIAAASGHHHRFVQAWFGGKVGLFRTVFDQMVDELSSDPAPVLERTSMRTSTRTLVHLLNWLVATDGSAFKGDRPTPLVDRITGAYESAGLDGTTARMMAVRVIGTTISMVLFADVLGVSDDDLGAHMALENELVQALLAARADRS